MKNYQDMTLLPGSELSLYFLWEKIYHHLHKGLVDIQLTNGLSPIGVAFPEYNEVSYYLGTKLRLMAPDEQKLSQFDAKKRFNLLADYIHLTSIREIPNHNANFVRYKRKQAKSNPECLARRYASRQAMDYNDALTLYQKKQTVLLKLPFVKISSNSSGQKYRLFIEKESCPEGINQNFSCYGLSAISTVPEF